MHLLVDGWNVIHSHPKLKKIFQELSQEAAVNALSDMICSIHDIDGVRLTIVLDGKGDKIEINRRSRLLTYSEIYTPSDMSADDFIEQYCSKHKEDCIVATRDNLLSLTASSFGATTIYPDFLFDWAKSCRAKISKKSSDIAEITKRDWFRAKNPFKNLKK